MKPEDIWLGQEVTDGEFRGEVCALYSNREYATISDGCSSVNVATKDLEIVLSEDEMRERIKELEGRISISAKDARTIIERFDVSNIGDCPRYKSPHCGTTCFCDEVEITQKLERQLKDKDGES